MEGETELGQITVSRRQRAVDAFNTIADWTDDNFKNMKKEIMKNSDFLKEERAYLEKSGAKKSIDPFGVITYHGFEDAITQAYEENATKHFFYFGLTNTQLKTLLENNYDHFQPYSKVTYEVFHALALEEAKKVRQERTPNDKNEILENAYAIEQGGTNVPDHPTTAIHESGHI